VAESGGNWRQKVGETGHKVPWTYRLGPGTIDQKKRGKGGKGEKKKKRHDIWRKCCTSYTELSYKFTFNSMPTSMFTHFWVSLNMKSIFRVGWG
jgi:hypothetical protein